MHHAVYPNNMNAFHTPAPPKIPLGTLLYGEHAKDSLKYLREQNSSTLDSSSTDDPYLNVIKTRLKSSFSVPNLSDSTIKSDAESRWRGMKGSSSLLNQDDSNRSLKHKQNNASTRLRIEDQKKVIDSESEVLPSEISRNVFGDHLL